MRGLPAATRLTPTRSNTLSHADRASFASLTGGNEEFFPCNIDDFIVKLPCLYKYPSSLDLTFLLGLLALRRLFGRSWCGELCGAVEAAAGMEAGAGPFATDNCEGERGGEPWGEGSFVMYIGGWLTG